MVELPVHVVGLLLGLWAALLYLVANGHLWAYQDWRWWRLYKSYMIEKRAWLPRFESMKDRIIETRRDHDPRQVATYDARLTLQAYLNSYGAGSDISTKYRS